MRKRLPFLGLSSFLITLSLLLGPNLLASDSKTKNLQLEAERTILQKLSLNDGVFYGNFGMIQNGNFNLMSSVTVDYTAEDLDYCIPEGTNSGRYIDNFSTTGGVQDISNMGTGFSPGGYGDFFDTHEVSQIQGQSITVSANIVGGTAGF